MISAKLICQKLQEYYEKDDAESLEIANAARLEIVLQLLFGEENLEHVFILFARDWKISGAKFRTTQPDTQRNLGYLHAHAPHSGDRMWREPRARAETRESGLFQRIASRSYRTANLHGCPLTKHTKATHCTSHHHPTKIPVFYY